jgi:hypothetical protein
MRSSSGHSLLKFLVPVVFIFLIGGFVAYNSGLFLQPEQPKPKSPEKTALPIVIPPKNTLPATAPQAVETPPEKTKAPVEAVDPAGRKIRYEAYMSGSKSTVVIPSTVPETTAIQPIVDTQPPREVYFHSSKSMPVKFDMKPQGVLDQFMVREKQQKRRKK